MQFTTVRPSIIEYLRVADERAGEANNIHKIYKVKDSMGDSKATTAGYHCSFGLVERNHSEEADKQIEDIHHDH